MSIRQPTIFLDLSLAPTGTAVPRGEGLPGKELVEHHLVQAALSPFLDEMHAQRKSENDLIARHLQISLNELIHRQNMRMADLMEKQIGGDASPLLAANIKTTEDRLFELNARLERRRDELQKESTCAISDIQHLGRAWVLPHPERNTPAIAPMVRDEEIERIAVAAVIAREEAEGRQVQSVEADNRGFDLISRRPHPEDPQTAIDVRFIEVKGRAGVGEVALTDNEYKTAQRMTKDYWLYVVFNCGTTPQLHLIRDPARLGWEPIVRVEHYHVKAEEILGAES
jgi:hypothetical protein